MSRWISKPQKLRINRQSAVRPSLQRGASDRAGRCATGPLRIACFCRNRCLSWASLCKFRSLRDEHSPRTDQVSHNGTLSHGGSSRTLFLIRREIGHPAGNEFAWRGVLTGLNTGLLGLLNAMPLMRVSERNGEEQYDPSWRSTTSGAAVIADSRLTFDFCCLVKNSFI